MEEWSKGDDPLEEHRRHYPTCPFIIPLTTKPEMPEYVRFSARLKSFAGWGNRYPSPEELASSGFFRRKSPNQDCVRCFYSLFHLLCLIFIYCKEAAHIILAAQLKSLKISLISIGQMQKFPKIIIMGGWAKF